jgi:hypothetical protein
MGVAPADIIQQITATSYDALSSTRQYGVVDLQGRAAGFTGTNNTSVQQYREDRQGTIGTYTYSVQGNVLTGVGVINQAETAFKTKGCDLADKLMLALEGGAENGQGDSRCTTHMPTPVPADAASIEVDLPGQAAGSYLKLSFASSSFQNAVVQLRSQFNTWRATHPCGGLADGGTDAEAGTTVDAARDGVVDGDAASSSDVTVDRSLDATTDTAVPDVSDGAVGADMGGGAAGVGGGSGSGGAAGASGKGGTGGATGGTSGTGGTTGGTSGTGGAGGAGGSSGAISTGGSGGASGTGGTSGSAGRAGAGTGGASTGTSGSGNGGSGDDGCSCRLRRSNTSAKSLMGMVSLLAVAVARSRYRRRRSS